MKKPRTKTVLKILGIAWLVIATTLILAGLGMIWYTKGFSELASTLSPFNITNYLLVGLTISPGIILLELANTDK